MSCDINDELTELSPISDYYVTYHLLLRAKALLTESTDLIIAEGECCQASVQVDQHLFEYILEVKHCLESIKFKHDVLAHPVTSEG